MVVLVEDEQNEFDFDLLSELNLSLSGILKRARHSPIATPIQFSFIPNLPNHDWHSAIDNRRRRYSAIFYWLHLNFLSFVWIDGQLVSTLYETKKTEFLKIKNKK